MPTLGFQIGSYFFGNILKDDFYTVVMPWRQKIFIGVDFHMKKEKKLKQFIQIGLIAVEIKRALSSINDHDV